MTKPVSNLIHGLFKAGLLQVGIFRAENGQTRYLQQRLELLQSYPDLLSLAAEMMVTLLPANTSRLISAPKALPLATAMSLASKIPLVCYTGEVSGAMGRDFVGAYDIEHPSIFITHSADDYDEAKRHHIALGANKVGLQINHWLSLIDEDSGHENSTSLIDMADAVQEAVTQGLIPVKLADVVLADFD